MTTTTSPSSSLSMFSERMAKKKLRGKESVEGRSHLTATVSRQEAPALSIKKVHNNIITIGKETFIRGQISCCDKLVVEGTVEAENVEQVDCLTIGDTGRFKGNASVNRAEIRGVFQGKLSVDQLLVVETNGVVKGDVSYGMIEIKKGGMIQGTLTMHDQSSYIAPSPTHASIDLNDETSILSEEVGRAVQASTILINETS